MRIERAVFVADKGLRQGAKCAARAVPGEFVGALRLVGAEVSRSTQRRVRAVGADYEVVAFECRQRGLELGRDPRGRELLAQQAQEMQPADRREADTVDHDALA